MKWFTSLRSLSPEEFEKRELEVTDLGVAFATAQAEIEGATDTSLPAIYRAIQLLADIAASLPLEAIDRHGIAEPITPDLLERPVPSETYNSTMKKIMASLLLRGNAYLWARTRDQAGFIQSFYVLDPDEVKVTWDRAHLYPIYTWRGQRLEANQEIFHVAINHWPGNLKGVGPIEATRLMLTGMKAEQNMARRIFEDEATPTGVLKVPRPLSKEEAEVVQDMWEDTHGGRKRPAVLSGGVEFTPITISPLDAQFIEQRRFSIQEVARMFGLAGYFLLVDSGSSMTYATTEGLFRLFLTMTLNPTYLEPIEQVISLMLPKGTKARFRTDEILKADLQARYQAYALGLEKGFLTVEEIREMEHLPRIDPGAGSSSVREVAEILQKLYLSVGTEITEEEARRLVSSAGVNLEGGLNATK